ncbi:MAG: CARDB domain-containing protein, partial [Myxococcota bacterium]|nr:CARDB domain-containing protein [Myxococcota bacterium]
WDPEICLDTCAQGTVDLFLRAGNGGLLDTTGFGVRVVRSDGATLLDETTSPVAGGEGTVLGPYTVTMAEWGAGNLTMVVDPDDEVAECDEEDNELDLGLWP